MRPELRPSSWLPLAAFLGACILHVDAPAWALAVALMGLGWQLLHLRGLVALPGSIWRGAIAFGLLVATLATFRGITGLTAGTNLLLVMGSAKLLEIRRPRDARVMIYVSLALLMAAVLEQQQLSRVPLYLASAWLSLAALAALGASAAGNSARVAMAGSGRTLLYALPLAALCFVLVPRLPGGFWSLPADESAATGLGDEMSPGSISELSTSEEIAFRVRFDDAPPPMSERYWRGPVLHDFDGQTWRRTRQQAVRTQTEPLSAAIRYRILQEPTGRNYLFGLDTIASISGQRSVQLYDGLVLSTRAVTSTIAYEGISYTRVRATGELSKVGRRIDTALPEGPNPRARELARQLRAQSTDDSDYVQRTLRYFRDAGLQYTLSPPRLGTDSVDELLFRTRLGFCGHFASAYVTLMRAAGVPARVVTGYLGGTWNAVGGYYAIRQSDAHAWAEVWLDGAGWTRVDPTTVVAPARLRGTLDELLGDGGSLTRRMLMRAPWLGRMRDSWDAAANWWQERVVNYNLSAQLALLRRLGLPDADYRLMALALLAGASLWGAWVSWRTRPVRNLAGPDSLGQLWIAYERLLRRRGVAVAAHDAPASIAQRAARMHTSAASEIAGFSELYLRLRFGAEGHCVTSPAQLRELRRRLRNLVRAARR